MLCLERRIVSMDSEDTLLVPQKEGCSLLFGIFGLALSAVALFFEIRSAVKFERPLGGSANWSIIIFIISLLSLLLLHIYEFNKEDGSLTIYWGLGVSIGNQFIKLPLVWRSYPGKKITKLGIFRVSKRDTDSYGEPDRYYTYPVRAMVGRKWIDIGSNSQSLQRSKEEASKISEFLGVPVEDKSSRTRS
jgi:hypothetical protein